MNDTEILRPKRTSLLIGGAVFLVTCLLWQFGCFQEPELWVYDHFVKWHSNPQASDPRIVLVLQDEKDIEHLDYPLRDKVLAEILEKIESGGPAVIGLDLYRDLPVPRDGSESAVLTQTLLNKNDANIITIFKYGTEKDPFLVPPPAALANDSTRYAFNDFPYDYKTVRRGLLLMPWNDTATPYQSFSLSLAQFYLARQNVLLSQDGDSVRLGKTTIHRFQSNDGGYIQARDGGYQFLLDFRGPPNFASMSIGDVQKLPDSSVFKDKIVLIGSSAESSNDKWFTPLDEQQAGTYIHAIIVNQLLRVALDGDRPVTTVGTGTKWIWMLVWCLAGIGVGFFVRSHILFALAIGLCSGGIVLSGWLLFVSGYWILIFAPVVVFLATSMLIKAYAANHEEQQRAHLMKLFSQHVSPEIAEEIWTHRHLFLQGGRPAAQRLVVTVLFSDLKNYSTISEKMSPAELIAWINDCQSALAQHVGKNGGIINTYMGDGMMAVFGIPVARTTETEMARDAMNAIQCALSMAHEIEQMNARWEAEGKPLAGLRVGIHTGVAMAGVMGSDDHLEYSVIGDTSNIASRLESFDKEETQTGASGHCRILVGGLTYQYIKERFSAVKVEGEIALKGKKEKVEVYKILDHIDKVGQSNANANKAVSNC
jgi:adenylate cyclase